MNLIYSKNNCVEIFKKYQKFDPRDLFKVWGCGHHRGRNNRPAPAKTGSNLRLAGLKGSEMSQKSRLEITLNMLFIL